MQEYMYSNRTEGAAEFHHAIKQLLSLALNQEERLPEGDVANE